MKSLLYWIKSILADALIYALAYFYLAHSINSALDVLTFWCWTITIIRAFAGWTCDKTTFEKNPRPSGFNIYHGITEILLISFLVFVGCTVLASFYLIALILIEGARNRDPKAKVGDK